MSDDNWDESEFEATSEGFKSLRAAFDKIKKDLAAEQKARETAESKVTELNKSLSSKSLNELTQNLPPNVKKFLTKDFDREGTEVTQEKVDEWLKENGDDFGYKPGEETASTEATTEATTEASGPEAGSELPPEVEQAYAILQEFQSHAQAPTKASGELPGQLDSLSDPNISFDDALNQLRGLGAPLTAYGS